MPGVTRLEVTFVLCPRFGRLDQPSSRSQSAGGDSRQMFLQGLGRRPDRELKLCLDLHLSQESVLGHPARN